MAVFMRRLLSDSPDKYCFSKVSCAGGESLTVIDFEMPFPDERHKIVGYCNGLFCLEYADGKIVVWNPTNKSFQGIPSPTNLISPISSCPYDYCDGSCTPHTITVVCGFGQDINTHDYKVVTHVSTYFDAGGILDGFLKQAYVYSLGKNDGWKEISYPENVHLAGVIDASGTWVNGCCYWIAQEAYGNYTRGVRILSLDLATLEFSLIELPDETSMSAMSSRFIMMELEESLGLIMYKKTDPKNISTWVWMGDREWRHKHFFRFRFTNHDVEKPLGYLNELMILEGLGEELGGSHLLMYDYALDKFWKLDLIHDRRRSMRLFSYVESSLHLNRTDPNILVAESK